MGQSKIDVAAVADGVIDAMGNQHAFGPSRKVMVKGLGGFGTPAAAFAKQLAEKLFGFGVHGKDRVPR
ncbi:MAG: hypothetical protein KDA80_21345 [Planctomycetaceae bacterium]|nr:hypothetical protein [Planctomycetaceae bacterium]